MDLAVPRFSGEARAGEQQMVRLERRRGVAAAAPRRYDQPHPGRRFPAGLRSAAPNASLSGLITRSAPPGRVPVEAGQARPHTSCPHSAAASADRLHAAKPLTEFGHIAVGK
jgi:hypothetical protein